LPPSTQHHVQWRRTCQTSTIAMGADRSAHLCPTTEGTWGGKPRQLHVHVMGDASSCSAGTIGPPYMQRTPSYRATSCIRLDAHDRSRALWHHHLSQHSITHTSMRTPRQRFAVKAGAPSRCPNRVSRPVPRPPRTHRVVPASCPWASLPALHV